MISALIVAYELPTEVEKLIAALREQTCNVDSILVVDNGRERRVSTARYDSVEVTIPPRNLGVSGAFRVGMERARAEGAQFLWVFDQDSLPADDCLERLLACHAARTREGIKIGVVAPQPRDSGSGREIPGLIFDRFRFRVVSKRPASSWYSCDAVIASGSLIDIEATANISLPEDELFIDGVDWRFCMACRASGLEVIVDKSAGFEHRLGRADTRRLPILGRTVDLHHYAPLRYFYISRNHSFVELEEATKRGYRARSLLYRFVSLGKLLGKLTLYEREDLAEKWRMCLRGFVCGVRGRITLSDPIRADPIRDRNV